MNAPSRYAIEAEGLTKIFGKKKVVDNLSLRVERGRIHGFLGPNGSGKTTTIRMLCGLLTPDSGKGSCLGFDIRTQQTEIKRHVGYMTQRFSLYGDLSIRENLEFVARVYGVPDPCGKAEAAIRRLGLEKRSDQLAAELSGGWKQRLALSACVLPEPQLLLLDEPTAGVDPKARRDFWDEIHNLAAQGLTVLVSTHYMDEAERCHEIAYIAQGKLLANGSIAEIIAGAGLTTFIVTGPGLTELSRRLAATPGVDMSALFGSTLHVSARDAATLKAIAAAEEGSEHRWTPAEPTLEDVFIDLMRHVEERPA